MAILRLSLADARTISHEAELPYGRIYDTLEALRSKNVVNVMPGRPKKYSVVEPNVAIDNLLREKQKEVKELEKDATKTKQDLNRMYERKPDDKLVWKTALGNSMYEEYFDMLYEAKSELLLYFELTHESLENEYLDNYLELFQKMKSAKINVKAIYGVDDISVIEDLVESHPAFLNSLHDVETRYTHRFHYGFLIIDREKVIVKVANPLQLNEMMAGIYIWQKSMGKVFRDNFQQLWEEAIPLQFGLKTTQ